MNGRVFHQRSGHEYSLVNRGEGVYLDELQGQRQLDALGGAQVVNTGRGRRYAYAVSRTRAMTNFR
jgi:adenosylmethionine-8-amino-7-oxononanoate aminotransferase